MPSAAELAPYISDRALAAERFGVSSRTVTRWMHRYGMFEAHGDTGRSKLDMVKAREMRAAYSRGATMKELAAGYGVTVSAVSRVVRNVNYREARGSAEVSVVYNPVTAGGAGSSAAIPPSGCS